LSGCGSALYLLRLSAAGEFPAKGGEAAARYYTPALAPVIMRCYAAAGSFLYFGNDTFYRCGNNVPCRFYQASALPLCRWQIIA